jgi:hypothetical protein
MTKGKRAATYLRVSTDGQTVENQRCELKAAAKCHGWQVVERFADEGISGPRDATSGQGWTSFCWVLRARISTSPQLGQSIGWAVRFKTSSVSLARFTRRALASTFINRASIPPRQPVRRCSRCSGCSHS